MKLQKILLSSVLLVGCMSCSEEFLEVKRNISQVVPYRSEDFRAILDYTSVMNVASSHELGAMGSDEFYLTEDRWEIIKSNYQKQGYIWADNPFGESDVPDWNNAYYRILHANLCIDACLKEDGKRLREKDWQDVYGNAMFIRAWNYYQLAQEFVPPLTADNAWEKLGLPIRTDYDITLAAPRSTIEETYQAILKDSRIAASYLPLSALVKYRPNRPAAYALLSKTYLQMQNYPKAKDYADSCLQLQSELLDFNVIDASPTYPFAGTHDKNPEIMFLTNMDNIPVTTRSRIDMDGELLNLYEEGDLRRDIYYAPLSGKTVFKGSYRGNPQYFTGLAVDEIYLIRAESNLRTGNLQDALGDLNWLRKHRIDALTYEELISSDETEILNWIIEEKRKELVFRGTRWEDLRRWNQFPSLQKTIRRELNGIVYELKPNSNKYTWPIPFNEIEQGKLEQNPR